MGEGVSLIVGDKATEVWLGCSFALSVRFAYIIGSFLKNLLGSADSPSNAVPLGTDLNLHLVVISLILNDILLLLLLHHKIIFVIPGIASVFCRHNLI